MSTAPAKTPQVPKFDRWDICPELHAMSDFGFARDGSSGYGRSTTNNAECYLLQRGERCKRRGRCLIALFLVLCSLVCLSCRPRCPKGQQAVCTVAQAHTLCPGSCTYMFIDNVMIPICGPPYPCVQEREDCLCEPLPAEQPQGVAP